MSWGSWTSDLIDVLLPTGCVICRDWIPGRGAHRIVCVRCSTRLSEPSWPRCPRCHAPRGTGRSEAEDCLECREWPAELECARYAYRLEGAAADLVHALKYQGWGEAAPFMSRAMASGFAVAPTEDRGRARRRTIVVPVPTSPSRERARGYNQAGLLAKGVSQTLALPLYSVLARSRSDRSQTSLSPEERRENVRGVFSVSGTAKTVLAGARVVLVDDVLTTGATAGEAARVLVAAGGSGVVLLTFARALPGRLRGRSERAA